MWLSASKAFIQGCNFERQRAARNNWSLQTLDTRHCSKWLAEGEGRSFVPSSFPRGRVCTCAVPSSSRVHAVSPWPHGATGKAGSPPGCCGPARLRVFSSGVRSRVPGSGRCNSRPAWRYLWVSLYTGLLEPHLGQPCMGQPGSAPSRSPSAHPLHSSLCTETLRCMKTIPEWIRTRYSYTAMRRNQLLMDTTTWMDSSALG